MDNSYISAARKIYHAWRRGKKPLHTMNQDELIMLDEYMQLLRASSAAAPVPAQSSPLRFLSKRKIIVFALFAIFLAITLNR